MKKIEKFEVPEVLKNIINEIIWLYVDASHDTIYDKFISSCTSGIVFHFQDTFEIFEKDRKEFLPKMFFTGSFNRYLELKTNGTINSIIFILKPYGLFRVFGLDMAKLSKERYLDAFDTIGTDFYNTLVREENTKEKVDLICMKLIALLKGNKNQTEITDDVCDQILKSHGVVKIETLIKQYKINERYLRRKFIKRIGLPAKQFAMTARILYLLENLPILSSPEWIALVNDFGYTDQSHLIKDFKSVIGETPEKFFNRNHEQCRLITFLSIELL
ncbi:MAG: AraC family transcriptional regulator [Salinivirgaceae bacterium]|nr:AraC family transcriptional regulator [Salinivirgaceae bacterium]